MNGPVRETVVACHWNARDCAKAIRFAVASARNGIDHPSARPSNTTNAGLPATVFEKPRVTAGPR
jgi:hypothetical protein